jgi:CDP-diacylglycerol--glycerol-3-phosphate 3-phosphatidyltransferase
MRGRQRRVASAPRGLSIPPVLSFVIFLRPLMSLYTLKPRFQALLRPSVRTLHGFGVTANQVTVAACAASVGLGATLAAAAQSGHLSWFLLLPIGLLLRMALNAIDGMLAREFAQSSTLGAYLNELCDMVSDAALYLPFALLPDQSPALTILVILLANLAEMAGVLRIPPTSTRRNDGPMGKSDRARWFSACWGFSSVSASLPRRGCPGCWRSSPCCWSARSRTGSGAASPTTATGCALK